MIRAALRFMLCALSAAAAQANPFNFDQGDGRIIVDAVYTTSPRQFDNHGHVYDAPNYTQTNVYVLGEYGLTDKLNLLATPSLRSVQVDGPNNDSTGLGYTELGARYQVAKGSHWAFDVQGLVRIPGTGRNFSVAQIGNNDTQYDLRALGGYTSGKSFVALEGSYRLRSGPANEFHVDATIGTRAAPRLLLLAAIYNTVSDGRGSASPVSNGNGSTFNYQYSYRYHDVYVSAVYDLTRRVAVQVGATATVAGRNALRQRGPLIGLWYTF